MPWHKYMVVKYGKYSRKVITAELLIFFSPLRGFLASSNSDYTEGGQMTLKQEGKNPIPVYVVSLCE